MPNVRQRDSKGDMSCLLDLAKKYYDRCYREKKAICTNHIPLLESLLWDKLCLSVEKQCAGVGFLYSSILGHDMVCMLWYFVRIQCNDRPRHHLQCIFGHIKPVLLFMQLPHLLCGSNIKNDSLFLVFLCSKTSQKHLLCQWNNTFFSGAVKCFIFVAHECSKWAAT